MKILLKELYSLLKTGLLRPTGRRHQNKNLKMKDVVSEKIPLIFVLFFSVLVSTATGDGIGFTQQRQVSYLSRVARTVPLISCARDSTRDAGETRSKLIIMAVGSWQL